MGASIGYALGALLLYNFWIWVIRHITTHHRHTWLGIHIFVVGLISTTIIWFFPWAIQEFTGLILIKSLSVPLVLGYSLYLILRSCALYSVYMMRLFRLHHWLKVGISIIIFLVLAVSGMVIGIDMTIVYFTLVAFGEEFIKFVFGFSLFEKLQIHYTDLLLFCLLSGFAFAFLENVFYIRYAIQPHINRMETMGLVTIAIKTITTRGLVNVAIHGFFTALIGLLSMGPSFEKQSLRRVGLGMMMGMGTHALYNTLVARSVGLMIPLAVVVSYGFISYVMFKSDTMFNQPQDGGIANNPKY